MPRRNIGWGWHLASPSEIAAWQLEVNKSWSCEKWLPCLLAQSPHPSPPTLSQTTQHVVFTIFISHQHQWNWIDWRKSHGNFFLPLNIKTTQMHLVNVISLLFSIVFLAFKNTFPPLSLQPMLWQEKLWKQERDSVRPGDHWQVGCVPHPLSMCVNR